MPNNVLPKATASSTTAACSFMLRPCSQGDRTLPSSCCTPTTIASTISAPVMPFETSAIRTARAPNTNAPTIGMNPPKNVMIASGTANGTPTRTSPMPMNTASTKLTMACVRMNPPRVSQQRRRTLSMCTPALSPATRRTHGRNLGPSLTKKNVNTRTSAAPTMNDVTALTPVNAPDAMVLALSVSFSCAASIAVLIWSSDTSNGPSMSHSSTLPRPRLASLAMSPTWSTTDGAIAHNTPPITANPPTMTVTVASAGGNFAFSRRTRAGGASTVLTMRASATGRTIVQICPISHTSRYVAIAMMIHRMLHRDSHEIPRPITVSRCPCGRSTACVIVGAPVRLVASLSAHSMPVLGLPVRQDAALTRDKTSHTRGRAAHDSAPTSRSSYFRSPVVYASARTVSWPLCQVSPPDQDEHRDVVDIEAVRGQPGDDVAVPQSAGESVRSNTTFFIRAPLTVCCHPHWSTAHGRYFQPCRCRRT